jgi:hypothetical protein
MMRTREILLLINDSLIQISEKSNKLYSLRRIDMDKMMKSVQMGVWGFGIFENDSVLDWKELIQ